MITNIFLIKDKITMNNEKKDKLLVDNIVNGSIITSKTYPLIWNKNNFRSLENLKKILDENEYEKLEYENKILFCISLRDLYIASTKNILDEEEIKLLKKRTEINLPIINININGLMITPFPTNNNIIVKFMKFELDLI